MKIIVILNPYANRWNAQKRIPEVKAAFQAAGIDYELQITNGPRHAIALAEGAVRAGCDAIYAAGGDGTISEVVNGMARAAEAQGEKRPVSVPLGVLALGSANDFVVNLGLPKDLPGAVALLSSAKTRQIDLGYVTHGLPVDGQPPPGAYFDNNSAIGLEPSITLIQQKITWLHGPLRYLLATLLGIARNPQWTMRLEWDDGKYSGPATLVTVGNNPLTGGLFYMTPHAVPSDGRLTFVYGALQSRLKILSVLPRTTKPGVGSYVEHPAMHEVHATWLRIHSDQPTPLHADGEIQDPTAREIEYHVLPRHLPVLVL